MVTAISLTVQWLSIRVSLCCWVEGSNPGAGKCLFIEISSVPILSCLIPDAIIVQSSVFAPAYEQKKTRCQGKNMFFYFLFSINFNKGNCRDTYNKDFHLYFFLSNQPQRIDRWKWNLPVFQIRFFTAIAECQWKSWSFDRMKKYICGKFWLHQKKKRFGFFFGKSLFLSSPIFSDSTEIPTIFWDPKNGRLTS